MKYFAVRFIRRFSINIADEYRCQLLFVTNKVMVPEGGRGGENLINFSTMSFFLDVETNERENSVQRISVVVTSFSKIVATSLCFVICKNKSRRQTVGPSAVNIAWNFYFFRNDRSRVGCGAARSRCASLRNKSDQLAVCCARQTGEP